MRFSCCVALIALLQTGCSGEVDGSPSTLPDGAPIPDGGVPDVPDNEPPPDPDPNEIPSDELFTCVGEPQSSPARIRRIGQQEWTRSIGIRPMDPAALNPLQPLPSHQYSTWSEDESMDPVVLNEFFNFVGMADKYWKSSSGKPTEVRCMYDDAVPDRACVDFFVDYFLSGYVLFRPASADETSRLADFAERAIGQEAASGESRDDSMNRIVSAAWLTTGALFRPEMGVGAGPERTLSARELGQAVAMALSDGPAGVNDYRSGSNFGGDHLPNIRLAIEDESILEPGVITGLISEYYGGIDGERADTYLDDRSTSRRGEYWVANKIHAFFQEWLDYTKVVNLFKDTPALNTPFVDSENISRGWQQLLSGQYAYETTVVEQLDDMIARIIVDDTDVFRTLMTSRRFLVPSNLADGFKFTERIHNYYNVTADVADTREARWIDLPADERAGVLTHPAWLAAHSGNFDNDPTIVHRGRWIRENLLCGTVPDVPITVDASFPDSTDHLPGQQRLEMATGEAACQGCHNLMNPLGTPFEIYNHTGILRSEDYGMPVSGRTTLSDTGDPSLDTEVADAVEFAQLLGDSPLAKRCFIRQVFRHFAGRTETLADACVLVEMETAYDDSGGSFTALLSALMESRAFRARHDADEMGGR